MNVRDEMVSLPDTQERNNPGLDVRETQFLVSTLVNCPLLLLTERLTYFSESDFFFNPEMNRLDRFLSQSKLPVLCKKNSSHQRK